MTLPVRFLLVFLTVVATLCSCSTISKRQTYSYPLPPRTALDVWNRDPVQVDHTLEQAHLADPANDPLRLLVRYQQANLWSSTDAAKSCALWNEVLAERQFPLFAIARLRAMEVCPPSDRFPSIETMMASTPEPWLTGLLLHSTLTRAQRTGDKAWELKLSLKQVDVEKLQSEKLKLLNRARSLAKELQDLQADQSIAQKIEMVAPRFTALPSNDRLFEVATDFKQARDFDKARVVYDRIVASDAFAPLEKLRALDGIRQTYKLQKTTDAFLKASKAYSDFAETEFLKRGRALIATKETKEQGRLLLMDYLKTRLSLARAVWTEGSSRQAETLLSQTERELKGAIPAYESVYVRSAIEEEAGRFAKTVEILKPIDATQIANRDLRAKILWSRAWNLRKLGRLTEAAAAFEAIVAQDETASRARFWLGKTAKDLGDLARAQSQFEKLIETDRLSWYALLSYRELGREMPSLAPTLRAVASASAPGGSSASASSNGASAFMPEEKLTFEWLLAAGENELARSLLNQIATDRRASYDDDQTLDLFQAYARSGDFQTLFQRLSELSLEKRTALIERDPSLQFPQPWPTLVQTASAKFNVQPELIYAIMRQESSFNPLARSGADAFGLMQLIPEMAKRAEKSAGIALATHEDLYRPETNIPLGTAFVRELQNHWHDSFIPTVASYNASEKAITGWIRTRYRGDVLSFIEDIPYEETRTYIKLVMRNYIFYKRLNSRGAPVAFPEWCLANLQDAKS